MNFLNSNLLIFELLKKISVKNNLKIFINLKIEKIYGCGRSGYIHHKLNPTGIREVDAIDAPCCLPR